MKIIKTIIILLIACIFGYSQMIIPSWFEKLPDPPGNVMYAVGYSGKYSDMQLAKQIALKRALKNMAKQKEITLIFDIVELSDGTYRLLSPSFEEIYEESILNKLEENFSIVDSSITADGYFLLIAYPANENLSIKSANDKYWGNKPEWTEDLPKSGQYVYGVGIVANYSSVVRGWDDADEYARFDVGKNIKMELESIHTSQSDDNFTIESIILRQSYDLCLHGATIIERWYDNEKDIFYSLCRMK